MRAAGGVYGAVCGSIIVTLKSAVNVVKLVDIVVKHPVAPLWPRLERAAPTFAVPRADQAVAVFVSVHLGHVFARLRIKQVLLEIAALKSLFDCPRHDYRYLYRLQSRI